MILIVFALPEESTDFLRQLNPPERSGRGLATVARGVEGTHQFCVAHIGMGAVAAAANLRARLAEEMERARDNGDSVALVIGAGFAGGVRAGIERGEVIADWRGREMPAGVARFASAGRIATAENALETPIAKTEFGARTGAIAVDMEGDAAARVCAEAGVPYVVVRAISDAVADPLPVPMPHWFDLERQKPKPLALVVYLATHPGRIMPFVRFVRGLAKPRAALAQSLLGILRNLP